MLPAVRQMLLTPAIPRRGLVAWHDLYYPNVLLQSNNFASASWTKAKTGAGVDPVVTAGQSDPDGGTEAFRLQLDAGGVAAGDLSFLYQAPFGIAASFGSWVKSNTVGSQVFGLAVNGSAAAVAKTATTTWQFFWGTGGSAGALGICARPDRGTDQSLDLLVWHPQAYPSASLPEYAATTTLQSTPDLSGHGYALTRGSNATDADTNDPTVLGPGLGFVTDDYAVTGNLSGVSMAGPWTAIVVLKQSGVTADRVAWCISADGNNWAGLRQAGEAVIGGAIKGAGTQSTSGNVASSTTANIVWALSCAGGLLRLQRLDTGVSVTAGPQTPVGTAHLTVGSLPVLLAHVDAMTAYEDLFYNRALSNAEIARIYRAIKAKWAGRGVTIL